MWGWAAALIGIVAVAAFIVLTHRSVPRINRYRGAVATGISPVGAIDHVEAAARALENYSIEREDNRLEIKPSEVLGALDVLHVQATRMDVGTRVDIWGVAEPELIAAVRDALARTPPWTNAL